MQGRVSWVQRRGTWVHNKEGFLGCMGGVRGWKRGSHGCKGEFHGCRYTSAKRRGANNYNPVFIPGSVQKYCFLSKHRNDEDLHTIRQIC